MILLTLFCLRRSGPATTQAADQLTSVVQVEITLSMSDAGGDTKAAAPAGTQERQQRELITRTLRAFDQLEQIDFGELEPVGISAPTEPR